ncbi:2-succinyl-5-enolpyruvyl-6-hydroxy-3-cyclohexene-1-carboxylic-acid synthase [Loigolactobacillus zhaoyuanensis]|uniref:2-succinyl-5-enolpyruvyl-6-hydroxy-3- cyclohexene-1-carboxylic-acid synthase n=1 Tax=Loigolactobacillus zhaoyuanensis TaxID=2486017 RepID=UPI000F749071|nr:2-succinyl-5-enolpyruvyl-6-hydroxy-3-cyclohexene-1-carboxylic-acid synthase [Loigolactobacillus zhaoyuanensis]
MKNETLTLNTHRLISGLVAQGVHDFIVSPGSRSTPVALLLAERVRQQSSLRLYVDVDERSAAFFALGIAKTRQAPVALLCTSGTAAAEYLPALAEAHLTHVPLVVLTTDRPLELTNIGAPQAIEQTDLYGKQVKQSQRIDLQVAGNENADFIAFQSQRSVLTALDNPSGPVQLNLPLRKPLLPDLDITPPAIKQLAVAPVTAVLAPDTLTELVGQLQVKKVLLLAGPEETPTYRAGLLALSKKCHWPILADNLANLRGRGTVITDYDLLFQAQTRLPAALQPEVILRFGGTPVSAPLMQWLGQQTVPVYLVGAQRQLADYSRATTHVLAVDEQSFLTALTTALPAQNTGYFDDWQQISQRLQAQLNVPATLNEVTTVQTLDRALPVASRLFISNSMPIRDVEDFYQGQQVRELYCNRGANGIDGVVSTAAGMATLGGANYLLIGDLALFHDMNGLMMVRRYQLPLTVVVINNNGGGIFSFLPQASAADYFEDLFGTPQALDLAKVAALYERSYQKVTTITEFEQALAADAQLIEVVSQRTTNLQLHRQLIRTVQESLANHD